MTKHSISGSVLLAALVSMAVPMGMAVAAPTPPPTVCVDGQCVTAQSVVAKSSGTAVKWHPGIYIHAGNIKCDADAMGDEFATIDQIGNDPNVKGIQIQWKWNCMEGDTPGDYSAAFARIDSLLARLATKKYARRLILGVWPMDWGNCSSTDAANNYYPRATVPKYVKDKGNGPNGWMSYCGQERNATAQLWNPAVMDRIIALTQAFAARYNNHPQVEMWTLHDESIGLIGKESDGFTWSKAITQWKRYSAAAAAAWNKTIVMSPINYYGEYGTDAGDATIRAEFATNYGNNFIFGACDTLLDSIQMLPGSLIWRGLDRNGTAKSGWTDFRKTRGAWFTKVVGGQVLYQNQTPEQSNDYAVNVMHSTHVSWMRINYDSGENTQQYWSRVWPFIQAGKATVYTTACPPGWTCDTN